MGQAFQWKFAVLRNACALAVLAALGCAAWAGPTGGAVTSGSAAFYLNGNNTTVTTRDTKVAINWTSFNTNANESVTFVQPSATSVVVNRIGGNSATQFFGHLDANGIVYVVNPYGVIFGVGSQVNVGGLVATTLNVSNSDAGTGNQTFTSNGATGVINAGTITTRGTRGSVALLGATAKNTGTINAYGGSVVMGSGDNMTLLLNNNRFMALSVTHNHLQALVENKGVIKADGGQIMLTAGARDSVMAGVVNNSGIIQARSVQEDKGVIVLSANPWGSTVNVGGTLDASAPTGGPAGYIAINSSYGVNWQPGAVVNLNPTQSFTNGVLAINPNNWTYQAQP